MVDILHRVGIKSSVDEVYEALATRDGLAGWWTTDTRGESNAGGVIRFRFGGEDDGFDMRVLELAPGKRVLWQVVTGPEQWLGTRIGFDLRKTRTTASCCSSTKVGRSRPSPCTTAARSGRCFC